MLAFLDGKIKITDIINIVENALNEHNPLEAATLDDILKLDEEIRLQTQEVIKDYTIRA